MKNSFRKNYKAQTRQFFLGYLWTICRKESKQKRELQKWIPNNFF